MKNISTFFTRQLFGHKSSTRRIIFFPGKLIVVSTIILLQCFTNLQAQVTAIYSDYNGYWTSSLSSISTTLPDNSHNMLAFTWNGTTFSTGVNDAILTAHSITFTPLNFRAFPINSVPNTSGGSYFVMLGQNYDGVNNGVLNNGVTPFPANPTGAQLASFLTDGKKGLDLGTGLANIPAGSTLKFNLSSNGISASAINDGKPDIFVTQMATPSSSNLDILKFVDASGNTVGNQITIDQTSLSPIGNWTADFYDFSTATQTNSSFINSSRPMRFFAADLSSFGITASNYANAVALVYQPNGTSDPAFIAFNEPAISVATQLTLTSQPTTYKTAVTMTTSAVIQVRDGLGQVINQSGIPVTASVATGAAVTAGTVTVNTDANGVATFSNLQIVGAGTVTLLFTSASLNQVVSANITNITTLPVSWISFTANQQNENIVLNWSTSNELNSGDFIIQHSDDGTSWTDIGTVAAAGNSSSTQQYNFVHTSPDKGDNYYRIEEKDLDGNVVYSDITHVLFSGENSIKVYPNPVISGSFTIQLPQAATVSLYNISGAEVLRKKLQAGNRQIDVSALSKGAYLLKMDKQSMTLIIP
ncbi:MAG: T9SS type A sorting domain-containing protein [Bacteroidetes bacterium]|nr:T9SS type A sorting domain-containing protein [Bacteroidota bacterium]